MLLEQFNPMKKNILLLWWRDLVTVLFLIGALCFGGFPSLLDATPIDTLFFELYVKDVFLIIVISCIIIFIQLLKPKPERVQEFFFLNSLPLTDKQLARHFLLSDLRSYSWLPWLASFLLFSLFSYAPAPHILRISFFIFLLYIVLILLSSSIHFYSTSKKFNPLSTLNPIFVFLSVFIFLISTTWAVLADSILSGISFWWIVFIELASASALLFLYQNAFKKWRRHNRAFTGSTTPPGILKRSKWHRRQWRISPILVKNIFKIEREKSPFVLFLTAMFLTSGYMVSRNNQRLDDFLAILNTAAILYAIIFAFRSQNLLSSSTESTHIVFALPIRPFILYASTLLPALLWMFLINTIFFLLALLTNVNFIDAILFWLKSFSLCGGLLIVAINFAFAAYPDEKSAQSHFLYWGIIYLVFMAMFFKYWYPIFLVMIGLSFLKMLNKKLYRFS